MKRKVGFKPRQKPMKRTRLRWVSPAKAKRDRAYNARVRVWKVENPWCKACWPIFGRLPRPTSDCHHMAGRSGPNLMDETTWLPTDRECHDWIGDNKRAARVLGLLK